MYSHFSFRSKFDVTLPNSDRHRSLAFSNNNRGEARRVNGGFTAVRSVAAHVAQTYICIYIYTLSSKCLCPDIAIMVNWKWNSKLLTYSKHLMYNNFIVILSQSILMYAHKITHTHAHTHTHTHTHTHAHTHTHTKSSHRRIINYKENERMLFTILRKGQSQWKN